MENILTIDVEEWHEATSLSRYIKDKSVYKSLAAEQTEHTLNILSEYKTKATFFVLGNIAESLPGLVNEISDRGHEVGIHGFTHRLVCDLSAAELKEEIKRARGAVEAAVGYKCVAGYRAPSWSITENSKWLLEYLGDQGFLYDSSLFAGRPRYGGNALLRKPDITRWNEKLWEVPPSTVTPLNIPFSGGFFLRFFPYSFIKSVVKGLNKKGAPAVVYLHPWELDESHPRVNVPLKERCIHYFNIKSAEKKLRSLLRDFKFTGAKEWLAQNKLKGRT